MKKTKVEKLLVLGKAFKVSMQIRGPLSLIVSLLGFPAALLPVLSANLLRRLTDELQLLTKTGGEADPALKVFAILVGAYVAQVVITNIQQYTSGLDEIKIERYINRTILRHKCEVRYKYIENDDNFQEKILFTREHSGRTMARCIGSMITILQLFVSFVVTVISLEKISPLIVAVLIATSIPAAVLAYLQQDETFRGRAKWMEEGALAIHYFHMIGGGSYSIDGLQEIRHFGLFDYLKGRWRAIADQYISKKNKIMAKHVKYNTIADFLRSAVYAVVLLIAAWEIYENPVIGLGTFTMVYSLSGQLQTTTRECLVGIMVLAQNIHYMQEFFHLEELEREPYALQKDPVPNGGITFEKVSFSYPNSDIIVLKDINVHIRDGEKVAIVGENGSGKSTFISLLCGMFNPGKGKIRVGGVDVSQNAAAVRSAVSVVFQDFAHYEASLRENITVSDKDRHAADDEIMELLRQINVDDIIDAQPNGLEEVVGSFSGKGNNLSGGQWQKISIARAAYRQNARIMILDEPTSALDPVEEAKLYRNFAALTGDKTTILISHRLGITAMVDRILVFHEGRIIEDGSHQELMAGNGRYAEMYREQAKWYQ